MTKRRKIIIGLVVGIPVFLVGLAVLLITLLEPPLPEPIAPVEEKTVPSDWLAESPDEDQSESDAQDEETRSENGIRTGEANLPFNSTGSLAFFGGGKPFGSESYQLTITEEGATLSSTGLFEFRVVLATIRVTYTQSLQTDYELRPTNYTLDFKAPLGFGQQIEARFSDDTLTLIRKEEVEKVPVDTSRVLVLGTFSTYALVPALFEARAENGRQSFDVLVLGGPPREASSDQGESNRLPVLTVERLADAILEIDTGRLVVDQYRIQSELGDSLLLAKGKEFLGFIAGEEEETLFVYRSDYFPNGFTLVR